MKKILPMMMALIMATAGASAAVKTGEMVPDFTLKDTKGKKHTLSDLQGKRVILEWYNPDCPFVKKHYQSGNMQDLQEKYTDQGVVWLTINSSNYGKQGQYKPDEYDQITENSGAQPTALLLDHEGNVGKTYGAKTTPHMFIIDEEGTLVYQGAIDSDASVSQEAIAGAENYVDTVFAALDAGDVPPAYRQPYGCSVKY